MKILVPNYYQKFRCIADRCQHSCCIGWEIAIDEKSRNLYETMPGEMGDKIRQKIVTEEEPHFSLEAGDRCPFLLKNGLCEIICQLGEDILCDICKDHPRFRNFYSDFTEMGLGLCCEAAAKIMLEREEPFGLTALSGDAEIFLSEEEEMFFARRDRVFAVIQNREEPMLSRLSVLATWADENLDDFNLLELSSQYLSLERLDETWTSVLKGIENENFAFSMIEERFFIPIEQLLCYFLYRHLADALWTGDFAPGIRFALKSCYMIAALWYWHLKCHGDITIEEMADYARMYSAEVEYCEENLNQMMQ